MVEGDTRNARVRGMVAGAAVTLAYLAMIFSAGSARVVSTAGASEPAAEAVVAAPVIPESVTVPVLVYHHVRDDRAKEPPGARVYEITLAELDAQLAMLAERGYQGITMTQLERAFAEGTPLPSKPVLLTFDDGRADQYANAVPLLAKRGFVATFYVFSNAIDRPDYFTSAQLREMAAAGHDVQSHTRYHHYLTKASDADLAEELTRSKARLEEVLGGGARVTSVAYPFGLHDDRVVRAAAVAGYVTGRTLLQERAVERGKLLRTPGWIVTGDAAKFARLLDTF